MTKTVFITGCSSGIGRTTAKYFQERGWNVVATVRGNPSEDAELVGLENVLVAQVDVTEPDTVAAAMDAAIKQFGQIDVLINNAGFGAYGVLEATPIEKIRKQFEVNVVGLLSCTKAVLPHMRGRAQGTIINISSMGGKITFPLGTLYHGSKFAVEGMSEAMSYELDAIGIKVKLVEPGNIRSNFAETTLGNLDIDPSLTEYGPFLEKVMAGFEAAAAVSSEPTLVAEAIWQAATDQTDQMRYVVGLDAEQIIAARKSLEDREYLAVIREGMGL